MKFRQWYLDHKGVVGHTATGLLAGGLVGWGVGDAQVLPVVAGFYFSAQVHTRQTVSWLHKRDKVGKDLQEHIQAAVVGFIMVFGFFNAGGWA